VLKYGVGTLRPAWEPVAAPYPPMSTYKWADTERALTSLARVDADPFDDVVMEYVNPQTGGAVMRSFTCRIQLLRPGIHTRAHRHTGSAVYLAFEGHGETVIDGVRFEWRPGDMFVIPSWAAHEHINHDADARAILFSVHDTPLLRALDKYREEPLATGHQDVIATFSAEA
jgi:gentisate 1,2-dioxygenase